MAETGLRREMKDILLSLQKKEDCFRDMESRYQQKLAERDAELKSV